MYPSDDIPPDWQKGMNVQIMSSI